MRSRHPALLVVVGRAWQENPRKRWGFGLGVSLVLVVLPCLFGAGAFLHFERGSRPRTAASVSTSVWSGAAGAEQQRESSIAIRRATSAQSPIALVAPAVSTTTGPARFRDAASSWQEPGLCPGQTPAQLAARMAYLNGLRRYEHLRVALYADAAVSARVLQQIADSAEAAPGRIERAIGIKPSLPIIYVHRSVELLRANSCVGASAVAFYDGAVHLADVSKDSGWMEMWHGLTHELTHHALMSHGVREPIWLQEGLAMHVSADLAFHDAAIVPPGIDLREMVDGFPHTAPPEHAERFYGQAYVMVDYLRALCRSGPYCGQREMVEALRSGTTSPTALFGWAVEQHALDSREPALKLWQTYLEQRAARPSRGLGRHSRLRPRAGSDARLNQE